MRKAFLFLAILGLTSSLWAADPIIGTWKVNVNNTEGTLPPGLIALSQEPAKESIVAYREIDSDLLEFTTNMVFEDGSSRSTKWTFPKDGGMVSRILPEPLPNGSSYVYTKLQPGEWIVTVMENNRQIHVMRKIVSKDGKTMREIRFDNDSQGNTVEFVQVYDRQ